MNKQKIVKKKSWMLIQQGNVPFNHKLTEIKSLLIILYM